VFRRAPPRRPDSPGVSDNTPSSPQATRSAQTDSAREGLGAVYARIPAAADNEARFDALEPFLDERARRLFAASEARAAGRGGVAAVSRATGIARSTIGRGLVDLQDDAVQLSPRVRRSGGGSKPATETQPGLLATFE
jgi:hypothetical protein